MSKIIFLDIDGTLVTYKNNGDMYIPNSTKLAIDKARSNGHIVFLCSGRSINKFDCFLYGIQFDGFIGGTGCFAIYENKYIYHITVPKENTIKYIDYCNKNNIDYFVETNQAYYVQSKYKDSFISIFRNKYDPNRINKVETIDKLDYSEVNKFCYQNSKLTINKIKNDFKDIFYIEPFSFRNDDTSGEVTMPGIDKVYGIKRVIEYLKINHEDTIAIGDGDNDISMIKYCNVGIAMGNSKEVVKENADYVTSSLDEDGIYKAFKYYNLIN